MESEEESLSPMSYGFASEWDLHNMPGRSAGLFLASGHKQVLKRGSCACMSQCVSVCPCAVHTMCV